MSKMTKIALLGATATAMPAAIFGNGVRAEASDAKTILAALQSDFQAFKDANDAALKGKADVVAMEKVDRINGSITELQAALDDHSRRIAAMALNPAAAISGARPDTPETREYSAAFNTFFRSGDGQSDLKALAIKAALTTQSDPDGGYVVAPEIETQIDRVMAKTSAMRQLATVRAIGAATYKKLVGVAGTTSGWVGEGDTRDDTSTPKLSELEFPAMQIYAQPAATQEMLDDASFDIGAWLSDEVNIEFVEQEGSAFINGSGIKKPRGILQYDTAEDASWAWGKLGYKVSGSSTDITSLDSLIDLTYALKQGFRQNASWLMNRITAAKLRKLKDSTGQYLWQPSTQLGQPATLSGYAVGDDDNMPDVGAGAFPVAFGDFRRGYLIVDRLGVRVLRDPFTSKGYVKFYTTKRVGGGVQQFEAIKLLKVSA